MSIRASAFLAFALLFASFVIAQDTSPGRNQDKKKNSLPADVINARTVLVLVDPDTGVSMTDPNGNQIAQQDVEKALLHWGRLTPVLEGAPADLVITVHKGNGKTVNPTIGGVPVNGRPVILEGDTDVVRVGVQRGRPISGTGPRTGSAQDTGAMPRTEIGSSEDMFVVYRSNTNSAPVWRYTAKNALRSPNVPAVAEFRKAVEEAEKQQKSKP
jgi:hypothetical protein